MYQQINLADHTLVGTPGPLPANLVGLADSALADIAAAIDPPPAGLAGQGFWPVVITPAPSFDPVAQIAVPPTLWTADPVGKKVTGAATARLMTIVEFAAANPTLYSISRWRFFLALLNGGFITPDDMLAGVCSKAVPGPMATIIAAMPSANQQSANVLILGAPTFEITHEFVAVFQQAENLTDAQVIALWRSASLL